jgi:hypothetical protein
VSFLFKVAPYWSVIMVLSTFANVAAPQGNYDLNSAFENADRLLEQKRTGSQFYHISLLTLPI